MHQETRDMYCLLDSVERALTTCASRNLTLLCFELLLELGELTKSDLLFLVQYLLNTLDLICVAVSLVC
jgi:hypothetical protein